jgi:hypothetical protein
MTEHPLTDDICYQMSINNMKTYGDLRDAADWQLEQVIEWIEECSNYDVCFHSECQRMIADHKQAMRPQQQENN